MTYRVVKMSGIYYGFDGGTIEDQSEDLQEFVDTMDVVTLGEELADIAETLNIDVDDIEVVT